MRTMYLIHQDLVRILRVLFLLDPKLILHHLVHTKQEFDVPTTIGEKYTSRAYCRPNRNNEVLILLVQSLLVLRELHLLQP